MMVSLRKESNRQLGLKLGGRRTEPGIFVMEVLEGSVAAQDGRLHPHDRILAINGADVRYARLDHASTLIQESRYSVSLVVSRGTSVVDSPTGPEYQHLFRSPDPALPALHWRTKSAPERLVPRLDCHHKDINKSLGDVTDSGTEEVGLSASCESLDGRRGFNGGMVIGGSLGSLGTGHQSNEGSLASLGSTLHQSSGSLSSAARCGIQDEDSTPPALPPRPRHALAHSRSNDQLATPDSANSEGLREGRGLEDSPPQDATDGSISSRLKSRRSRDVSDISELSHGFSRSLRIEGAHLHQKTVTISKVSCTVSLLTCWRRR
uniref:PDZ domain-containing protein n=1 Tax=Scylla olivacea TaxID=85551 RepID=A0A0P4VZD1_SCYOL